MIKQAGITNISNILKASFLYYIIPVCYLGFTLYLNWIVYSCVVLIEREYIFTIVGEREFRVKSFQEIIIKGETGDAGDGNSQWGNTGEYTKWKD